MLDYFYFSNALIGLNSKYVNFLNCLLIIFNIVRKTSRRQLSDNLKGIFFKVLAVFFTQFQTNIELVDYDNNGMAC